MDQLAAVLPVKQIFGLEQNDVSVAQNDLRLSSENLCRGGFDHMMYRITADRLDFCRSIYRRFVFLLIVNMKYQILIERNGRLIFVCIFRVCAGSLSGRTTRNNRIISVLSPVCFRILNEIFLIHGIRIELERVGFHVFFKCFSMLFRNDPCAGKAIVPSVLHDDLRIAEVTGRYFFIEHLCSQHRIVGVFFECYAAVIRNRETLSLSVRLCCCVHENQFAIFLDRVAGAASADSFVLFIRHKGDGKSLPCYEVGRGHMQPVHRTPL